MGIFNNFFGKEKKQKHEEKPIHRPYDPELKLYKRTENEILFWEYWFQDEGTAIVHQGIVGQQGKVGRTHPQYSSNVKGLIKSLIAKKHQEGFIEIDPSTFSFLEIEYIIDGHGTEEDLDKRHQLEEYIEHFLSLTGQGHNNGGSSGSGTMEVGASVVDFEIAKNSIENYLKNSIYGNYSRIFKR